MSKIRLFPWILLILIVRLSCAQPSGTESPASGEFAELDDETINSIVSDVVEYIVVTLPEESSIANAKYRMTLGVGSVHAVGIGDSGSAGFVLDKVKNELLKNDYVSGRFRIISIGRGEAEALVDSLNSGLHSDDRTDPLGLVEDEVEAYDPRDLYLLEGTFVQSVYQERKDFYRSIRVSIELSHPVSRRVVLEHEFQRRFKWHKRKRFWKEVEL